MTKEKNIYIKNVFHMLSYAFRGLNEKDEERIEAEDFENTADLLCQILCLGFSHLLRRGLHKEFIETKEVLKTLRGKLDLGTTMNAFSNGRRVLVCDHDDFSEDNLLNRIVRCTLWLFLRSDEVKTERKAAIRRLLPYLENVTPISPKDIQWSRLTYSANNREYRLVINICYFALSSLLLTTETGDFRMKAFAGDEAMCRLYEKFILEYFRKEWPGLHANPSQVKWNVDGETNIELLPHMKTDITLTSADRTLIIDAKFYRRELTNNSDKDTYHSGNLYQIYSYVKNKDTAHDGSVSGMLLYAKTDQGLDLPENPFSLDGNEFSVRQLDLNQPFALIASKLNGIATSFLHSESGE